MTARSFRATIAALAVVLVVTILVAIFATVIEAQTGRQAIIRTTGPAKWRTFEQHAPETALQVARGNFLDTDSVQVFGRNPDIDPAGTEDIWNTGGTYVFPTGAETLSVVSSSATDDGDPAGTGAWSVAISGLDANFEEILEVVTLDGTTPVVTTATFLRVNSAIAVEAGSNGTNAGAIVTTQSTSGLTMFTMAAEIGRTQLSIFTVPADHTLLITRVNASISKTQSATAAVHAEIKNGANPDAAFQVLGSSGISSDGTSWVSVVYPIPINIPGRIDIKFVGEAGSNNTDVNGGFDGYLVDNR